MAEQARLYVIATPIGNPADITYRALQVLQSVDGVICEEIRLGSTLLKKLGIDGKELIPVNEHNETRQSAVILSRMVQGQSFALISDCGTPVFADPGAFLIQQVTSAGFKVTPVPGPSSLMAALSILDFKLNRFVYGGFLSRQADERRKELLRLKSLRMAIVLMDTPYRMTALLKDVSRVFGMEQRITLACNLTLADETIFRGTIRTIINEIGDRKAEFILIIGPDQ